MNASPHSPSPRRPVDLRQEHVHPVQGEVAGDRGRVGPEPGEDPILPFSVTTAPGFAHRSDLVDAYARTSGRDVSGVGFWHPLGLIRLDSVVNISCGRSQNRQLPSST
jgi:hypothetical protein